MPLLFFYFLSVPFVRRFLRFTSRHGCASLYGVARGDKFLQRVKGRTIRLCDVERHADITKRRCKRPSRRGFVDGVNRPVFLDSHIVPPQSFFAREMLFVGYYNEC